MSVYSSSACRGVAKEEKKRRGEEGTWRRGAGFEAEMHKPELWGTQTQKVAAIQVTNHRHEGWGGPHWS